MLRDTTIESESDMVHKCRLDASQLHLMSLSDLYYLNPESFG